MILYFLNYSLYHLLLFVNIQIILKYTCMILFTENKKREEKMLPTTNWFDLVLLIIF